MSSDEDEPAPSPSATVLARRASRVVKPMREESSSDDDAEEPEEWEGADETSCSEEEGEEVSGFGENTPFRPQRGAPCSRCRCFFAFFLSKTYHSRSLILGPEGKTRWYSRAPARQGPLPEKMHPVCPQDSIGLYPHPKHDPKKLWVWDTLPIQNQQSYPTSLKRYLI